MKYALSPLLIRFLATLLLVSSCLGMAGAAGRQKVFYEGFDSGKLDTDTWFVALHQWGGRGKNGGVVPENVSIRDGKLYLEAHGDKYTGDVKGWDKKRRIDRVTRVGAAIFSKEYFGSGSYEVRMKVAPEFGACSAIWTFYYKELYPGQPGFQAKEVGGNEYYAINHEIDIEVPGRAQEEHHGFSFRHALCNTWIGENSDEYYTGYRDVGFDQRDGEFHTYRFDWYTSADEKGPARVEFYIDDRHVGTNTKHVPTIAGRFWLGVWFPYNWTGQPDFDTTHMVIDWVKITPFNQSGDRFEAESFPDAGIASADEIQHLR